VRIRRKLATLDHETLFAHGKRPAPRRELRVISLEPIRGGWCPVVVESVRVDVGACVRCAACSSLAPQVFAVTRKGTRVVRQPEDARERAACRAAALICPTQAIGGAT
jgi:ferredoxin